MVDTLHFIMYYIFNNLFTSKHNLAYTYVCIMYIYGIMYICILLSKYWGGVISS